MAKFYVPTKLSENISETPEGFLLCLGVPIARTGEMEYGEGETPLDVGDDGKVHITRDAEEVFSPVTIASFEGKSVTIKHPEEFVNPDNWKDLSKGTVHNVRRGKEKGEDGEEELLADLLITDAFAIKLVKNGLREVSCGYEAEYEQTGKGKGKQLKIVGNHLALVEEGRAGSSYAINDEKGKVKMSKKLGEKIKALLGRTVDEAIAEEKKDDKAKDSESPEAKKSAGSETNTVMDKDMFDELVKAVHDLAEKVDGMKPKDAAEGEEKKDDKAKDDEEEKKDDKEAKDDDAEEEKKDDEKESEDEDEDAEILERVKALEAAVAKLLESKDEESEDDDDLEGEEGLSLIHI